MFFNGVIISRQMKNGLMEGQLNVYNNTVASNLPFPFKQVIKPSAKTQNKATDLFLTRPLFSIGN